MVGYRMHGDTIMYQLIDDVALEISGAVLNHQSVGIWDIVRVLPKGLPTIDGVLSLKSFQERILMINLSADILVLETEKSYLTKTKKMSHVDARFATGLYGNELNLLLGFPRSSTKFWWLVDSGNLDDILISKQTASVLQLPAFDSALNSQSKNIELHIGTQQVNSDARSDDILYDGALNFASLSQIELIINFKSLSVFIGPALK